jgi:arylsulfatase A
MTKEAQFRNASHSWWIRMKLATRESAETVADGEPVQKNARMRTYWHWLWTAWIIALSGNAGANAFEQRQRPPNVIIVFTDDQGYGDAGVYGATNDPTPNIDRLAREGMRFTDFYVAQAVCSASRAALLTGCYPNRIGIHGALGPNSTHGLHPEEMTLARLLKQRGYATAIFGKWHLGHHRAFLPLRHGFDEFLGLPYSNDMWPFHPEAARGTYPNLPLLEGNEMMELNPDQRWLTRRLTARAVDFIGRHRRQPFFLYLAHPMPHVPLYVSPAFEGSSGAGAYADVIRELDWSVGEILRALHQHRLDRHTLLIFLSDNGPWLSYGDHAGSAGPLREGKGTAWEGGVRVPAVMRWPGRIPQGQVCQEPAMTIDLFPTIARLTGAAPGERRIDGKDIWPLMSGSPGARSPQEAYFFYYHVNELHAVRSGRWKLVFPHTYRTLAGRSGGTGGMPVRYEHAKTELELYDLVSDPGETTDVAGREPEVVTRLLSLADRAREDLGDSLRQQPGANRREPGRL